MRIRLDERWIEYLVQLPESGMGYQRVDVRFTDGREVKNALVFNSEEIELPEGMAMLPIAAVTLRR